MRRTLATTALLCTLAGPLAAFDLQGHRGARGLAPENTIEAFAAALSIGVSTLEFDLGMTRDGVLVVHHDVWLNPDTTAQAGRRFPVSARTGAARADAR